jgi:SAM-dependent methyltransferase
VTVAVHTGAEYVTAITARESDRRARAAFRELVLRLASPGNVLFDFGAGTGLDARYFAECGLTVRAYDNDPRMREFMADQCQDLIASGRIRLESGSYGDFLARGRQNGDRGVDIVTANFAPLNLIDDLGALFARFHALTVPGGIVVASVLNPYYIGDAMYGWWWRNLPRLWRFGRYALPGSGGEIVRRSPADFAAQCAPWFVLERLFRGMPPRGSREAEGIGWQGGSRGGCSGSGCRFTFLLFRRNADS